MQRKSRTPKYRGHIETAVNAAKLSIELFNRVDATHAHQASIIFNAQAWELMAKGILIKYKKTILESDGRSFTAEKSINQLQYILKIITPEENKTIQQIISLRNEALHNVFPNIDSEIITHLLYYSLKTFHKILKERFRPHFKNFDKNYISIAFKDHTFYSHKLTRLFSYSKKFSSDKNKILFILDRACRFAETDSQTKMMDYESWKKEIKSRGRKSRIGRHLSVYDYVNKQDDVRFVPVETPRGYKAEVTVQKAKKQSDAISVLVKKSNPNQDYPHLTSELAKILDRTNYFIGKLAEHLKLKGNSEYQIVIKTGTKSGTKKYSDKSLSLMKSWLEKNPDFNPYKRKIISKN